MSQKRWQICGASRLHILCHSVARRDIAVKGLDENKIEDKDVNEDNNEETLI